MRSLCPVLFTLACATQPPAEIGLSPVPPPLRMTVAKAPSVLVDPPAPPPAPSTLFRESFDSGLPEAWEISLPDGAKEHHGTIGATTISPKLGAAALSLSMVDGPRRAMPHVTGRFPVSGGTHLRVSLHLRARGLDPGIGPMTGGGVVIEELGGPLEEDVLAVHDDLPRVLGTSEWVPAAATFKTRSGTRALRITLSGGPSLVSGAVDFDDLNIEALAHDDVARSGAPLEPDAPELSREVTVDGDTRPALLAPDATRWAVAVERTTAIELRAGFARHPYSDPDVDICYELSHAAERVIASGCLKDGDDQYVDIEASLPAGPPAEFQLRSYTDPPGGGATGAWGAPRIWPRDRAPEARQQPDIVLFIIDTLAADHTGMGGMASRPTSPVLDAFAKRNIYFSDATTPAGWTEPSMGSLVTGLMPSQHRAGYRRERIYNPISRRSSEQKSRLLTYRPLSRRVTTLAERLRDAGYLTQGVYTNAFFGNAFGFARGYDRYDKFVGKRLDGASEGFARALNWWNNLPPAAERPPAFLMMHVIDPHDPYRIQLPAVEGFEPPPDIPVEEERDGLQRYVEARPQDAESREFPEQLATFYQAEIRNLDDQVSTFLDAIERPNTAVIVVSDHGEAFGEHDRFIHGRTLYHEELHVPLIMKLPDAAGGGTTIETPVSTVGVPATLLALAGLPVDNLWPPLPTTVDAATTQPENILSEAMLMGRDRTALRQGRWKYLLLHPTGIRGPARKRPSGHPFPPAATRPTEQLYDTSVDHLESHDVAGEHPDVVGRLRSVVHQHLRENELGVHFSCAPGEPLSLRISPDGPVSRFVPFEWSDDNRAEVVSDRSAASVQIAGTVQSWGVVYTPAVTKTLSITDQDGASLFDGTPPEQPDEAETILEGRCRVWRVGQPGDDAAANLDDGDVQALQALGYID